MYNPDMKQVGIVVMLAMALFIPAASKKGDNPFVGRWDITVTTLTGDQPGWMEVVEKDGNFQARIQIRGGSLRPINEVKPEKARLILTLTPAAEGRLALLWELSLKGNQLVGSQKRGDTVQGQLIGVRAPELKPKPPKAWSNPQPLFNGKDLTGWEAGDPRNNHWVARNGELVGEERGSNLRTTRKFDDFKLHFEVNCPQGGNTGVYLRGRYEVQIEYDPAAAVDKTHSMGSIFGLLAPSTDLPPKPGEWENFDVTLLGRYVTIVRNGVTIIDNQQIPGITGGALDSREADPGPFNIQGGRSAGIKYRNITVSVPKR